MANSWDAYFRFKNARMRLLKRCKIDGDCWLWQGTVRGDYGVIGLNRRTVNAHRASYVLFVGPVGEGVSVMHTCKNKLCCAPHHLYLGIQERPLTPGVVADGV